jgi:hypothetical protein
MLALVFWVEPFALEEPRHREFSKRTLIFPSLLLEQQKKQRV